MSGARAKAGEVQEKLLTEISGKMTMLLTKFDTMTCGIHEFLNTVKNQTELIKTLAEKRTENIPITAERSQGEDTFPLLREMNDIQASMQAQKQKAGMSKMWKRLLNERKQAFWNMYRCNNIADIYTEWKNKEKPILPQKFLIKEINGEHPNETEIRANLAVFQLDTEISLLQARKVRYEEKFLSIDTAMFAEISEQHSGPIGEKIKSLWEQDTKREEEKSKKIWEKNKSWFEEYEKNYGENSIMKTKPKRKRKATKSPVTQEATRISPEVEQGTRSRSTSRNRRPTFAEIARAPPTGERRKPRQEQDPINMNRPDKRAEFPSNQNTYEDTNDYNWTTVRGRGRGRFRGIYRGRGQSRGGRQNRRGRGQGPRVDFLGRRYYNRAPDPQF